MKALDRRHRWEIVSSKGARTTHRCRVCGRTETFEHLVPTVFVDALIQELRRPSPWARLLR